MSIEKYGITDAHYLCDSAIFNTETDKILRLYQICDLLNQQAERIAELEEQLKNAIVLPIEIGEKCWTINCWKTKDYTTKYELHENIVSGYDIYKSMINNKLTLNIEPRAKTNYFGVQPYLFATKEEALAELEKLQGK